MNVLVSALVALLLLPGTVFAQNVSWVRTGVPDRRITGFQTSGCGDLNGDGYEDILTVVDGVCTSGWRSVVWFLSGRDGQLLREIVLPGVSPQVAGAADLGDMNLDGFRDYALLWTNLSGVSLDCEVRDGLTDHVLWRFPGFPTVMDQIIGDLDVDGDGRRDLVVCGYRNSATLGELRAYSNSGTLLYQRFGNSGHVPAPPVSVIGLSLAGIGDVDGDGRDDFAMGCATTNGTGAVAIVSGATGTYLRVGYGEMPQDAVGFLLSAAGDLDGDGFIDVVAGNRGTPAFPRGVVRAFSSRTAQPLFQWTRTPAVGWGNSVDARGVDLDGDGIGDVLVNDSGYFSSMGVQGATHAYSGRDGSEILFWNGQPASAGTYGNVILARTLKPPRAEPIGFAVIANQTSMLLVNGNCGHDVGSMVAYRGLPNNSVTLGPACSGTLSSAPSIGMSSLGPAGVRLHLSNAPAGGFAFLLVGVSTVQHAGVPLPAAMDPFGMPGCALRTSIEWLLTGSAGQVGIERGHLQMDLPLPVRSATVGGISLSAQWLVLGVGQEFPGGMSQALRWIH